MPAPSSFEYAIVRVVPRVERGERVNAGVILYCRDRGFLAAAIALDHARLAALAPDADVALIDSHLAAIEQVARGGDAAGPIGALPQAERFKWLVAPRSTVIQVSDVHAGLCADPAVALADALATLVQSPPRPA